MVNAEWLTCDDPALMLAWLRSIGGTSERKVRLFAVACCRRVWPWLSEESSRIAVEVAERFADGQASLDELQLAQQEVGASAEYARGVACAIYDPYFHGHSNITDEEFRALLIADAVQWAAALSVWPGRETLYPPATTAIRDMIQAATGASASLASNLTVPRRHAQLLRDLIHLDPPCIPSSWLRWNDGTVVKMAQTIYDERQWEDMPILADALEDAGCDSDDILRHCREHAEHARGCWVVDLLLGKE